MRKKQPPIDPSLARVVFDQSCQSYQSSYVLVSVIMHSRGRPADFANAIQSLVNTCSSPGEVEILVKLDTDDGTLPEYVRVLNECPFVYKVLLYDRMQAYWSLFINQNDLSKQANGGVLWLFNEDNEIVSGDWVKAFRESRDIYPDNIYVCQVPGMRPKLGNCVSPAYSREWFDVLEMASPHVYSDRFLCYLANKIGRGLSTPLIRSIVFNHSAQLKIGRPRINADRSILLSILRHQIKRYVPVFRAAIASASSRPMRLKHRTCPPGTKVGPGYTEPKVASPKRPSKTYPPGTKVGPGYTE